MLKFGSSAEVFQAAFPALARAQRCVEPLLNAAFGTSCLVTLDAMWRYVPLIMPEGMRRRYPARSKLRKKERIYDCSPQLNYGVFVDGSLEDQLSEYLRGSEESAKHLAG